MGTNEEAIANAEKIGFNSGFKAKHPFIKDKTIPIFVANFILMDYGTGAIFGCPAHDQRDFDFATKYNLEIIPVYIERDKNDKFKIEFQKAINPKNFQNKIELTQKLNIVLEKMIMRNPGQWIWTHNRWK